jgi:hypothetical protein
MLNSFFNSGLSKIVNPLSTESKTNKTLSPHSQWITGFTDAEGSIIMSFIKEVIKIIGKLNPHLN